LAACERITEQADARQAPWGSEVRACAAMGDAERTRRDGASDPERWADVLGRWDQLAYPAPAAYARWRLAEATLAAGRRSEAVPLWRDAHTAAVQLGANGLVGAIEAAAGRAAVALSAEAETPTPYGLTARELEVLALVAAGRTNRQIGEALFISEK